MPDLSLRQALELAVSHHQAGRLQEAEPIYRRILAAQPNDPSALNLLGTLCHQSGRAQESLTLLRKAIAASPGAAESHANLGAVLLSAGAVDESINASRRAIELAPQSTEAMGNLGSALFAAGRYAEAVEIYRRLFSLDQRNAVAFFYFGMALQRIGSLDEAIAALATAVSKRGDVPEWHFRLGVALLDRGHIVDAAEALKTTIAIQPGHAEAHNYLGITFSERAMIDDAMASYRKAIEVNPQFAGAHNNLGNALKEIGRVPESIPYYRRAAELQPDSRIVGNMMYSMHFDANYDAHQLYAEHVQWNERFAKPLALKIAPHTNDRNPNRRLKIGYVGLDLREHPVGRFMLPLLTHHDHAPFEIHCFTDLQRPDHVTQQMQRVVDRWYSTTQMTDAALSDLIRREQIDVLIDLNMHLDGTRLLAFARKPAPVQIVYLAYVSTTGLTTIDYRISDPYLDPPGGDESIYTEKTLRLPRTYWCYQPPPYSADLTALPAASNGCITFASFNNFGKVTPAVLDTWVSILAKAPGSRILIHVGEGSHRQDVVRRFTAVGIDAGRIEFFGRVSLDVYMRQYQRVDIALDPFPYAGGTTTCDSLWMGVPVVTRRGGTAVSRGGVSLLSNVGCTELIADSGADYIRIATDLAADLPRLSHYRSTLRGKLAASPVMNAPQFARDFEALLRDAWTRWATAS